MESKGPHNNGMHPTADTLPVKFIEGAARRVMPSVMWLPYTEKVLAFYWLGDRIRDFIT
jgi:hypothetical protein